MINHSVFLRQTSPIEPPDPASDARLRERLDTALARYCEGNAAAEDACRKWLAFEAGVLEARRVAPASLLALADAIAETRPVECVLSSPAAAFLTFRLLGLSRLPPVRAAVPSEGLPPLLAPPEGARWGCGLLPFRLKVRFRFRAGAPWLAGLLLELDRAAGDPSGGGWEIAFEETDEAAGWPGLPDAEASFAADAARAPALFEAALRRAEADGNARGAMFYEEGAARLLRDLPGLPLRDAMRLAESGRGWTRGEAGRNELLALWLRHRGGPAFDRPDGDPFAGPFAAWYAELGGPMAYARPLWYYT